MFVFFTPVTSFEEENERERKKQTHLPFILSFYSSSKFNTLTLLLHSPVKHDIHFFCTLWFVNPSVQITTLLFSLFTLFYVSQYFFFKLGLLSVNTSWFFLHFIHSVAYVLVFFSSSFSPNKRGTFLSPFFYSCVFFSFWSLKWQEPLSSGFQNRKDNQEQIKPKNTARYVLHTLLFL